MSHKNIVALIANAFYTHGNPRVYRSLATLLSVPENENVGCYDACIDILWMSWWADYNTPQRPEREVIFNEVRKALITHRDEMIFQSRMAA